jgi:arylsulfatase A-like enzyme
MAVRPLSRWQAAGWFLMIVLVCALVAATVSVVLANGRSTAPARLSGASPASTASTPTKQPNIVVILTDDQSHGFMWAMPKTQALIADKGVTLTNYMIPTSACCPSRASLLTGQFAHTTGVWTNEPRYGAWKNYHGNGNEERSLPVWLQDAGYRTGLFGKYLNGYNLTTAHGVAPPGWNDWVTFSADGGPTGAYYNYYLSDGTTHGASIADYSTDALARRANAFIVQTPVEQPVFVYYAPYAPHAPNTASEKYEGTFAGKTMPSLPTAHQADVSGMPTWVQRMPRYSPAAQTDAVNAKWASSAETLLSVDDAVASVIGTLADTGRLENTLIVYASDNGLMWGAHRLLYKTVPYDGATRVPAFLRWDGHLPAGTVDDGVAANVDLTATIVSAAGLPVSTAGFPLQQAARRDGVVLESGPVTAHPAYCGWREKQYLYVRWGTGEEEAYDYATDPFEEVNLAYRDADRALTKRLRAAARKACVPVAPTFAWKSRIPPGTASAAHPARRAAAR